MKRLHQILPLALAALVALSIPARAAGAEKEPPPMKVDKTSTGKASGSSTEKMTATVTEIDVQKREITVRGPKGAVETFEVGPEVRNLAQVAVGDEVVVEYHEGLFLALQAPGDPDVAPEMTAAVATAKPGEKPAAVGAAEVRATVTVESVDLKTRIVRLRGPAGGVHRVEAGSGVKLDRLKVGDRIAATYTEAIAISVEPKKKK